MDLESRASLSGQSTNEYCTYQNFQHNRKDPMAVGEEAWDGKYFWITVYCPSLANVDSATSENGLVNVLDAPSINGIQK